MSSRPQTRSTAVAISPLLLRDYRKRLDDAADGAVAWIEITPQAIQDGILSEAQVGVTGRFAPGTSFATAITAMSGVVWIHHIGAGVDRLLGPGVRPGVTITNSAGAYAPAIAEYVIAGMIRMSRGLDDWLDGQKQRTWRSRIDGARSELYRSRLGIVGYGAIGRHLAHAAKGLGMEIWATKRTPTIATAEPIDRLLGANQLEELLEHCDYVVIAASLNTSSRGLIGASELGHMRRGAVLINVARGAIVDQGALVMALQEGRLSAALLDVTDPEPLPANSPLWDTPRLWITPHISGETRPGYGRAIDIFCANLRLYLSGQSRGMGNLVDIPAHS